MTEDFYREFREPTILPEPDFVTVGHCRICDKSICSEDDILLFQDGSREIMVHENCAVFHQDSLIEFMDTLGLDYCRGTAKELFMDEYDWI